MNVEQEILHLRSEIEKNSRLYYDLDAPVISDYEYDMMMRRLKELEADPYDITSVQNLKYDTDERINETETDSQT